MPAAAVELERTISDEALELRLQLQDLTYRNAKSQILIRELQADMVKTKEELREMKETYIKNLNIDRARTDLAAAPVGASCQMGRSVNATSSPPAAANVQAWTQ